MQPSLRRIGLAAAIAGVLAACSTSSKNEAPSCEEGELELCACPGGSQGQRSCGSDGTFGSCECSDAGSGGSSGASGSGGAGGSAGSVSGGGTGGTAPASCSGTNPPTPPSCTTPLTCANGVSCCASLCLEGGTYERDNTTAATVSPFRLDLFEVTVARFRVFANANAPVPEPNSGKHAHLPGGGIFEETGWSSDWNGLVPTDKSGWDSQLLECPQDVQTDKNPTWTTGPGVNDVLPINCVSWYQAYAFCIWDGGFLPTEAELGFAYVNGPAQLPYPWGSTAPTPADAVFSTSGPLPVGSKPPSDSGFYDLAGNVFEYALDTHLPKDAGYPKIPCSDCAILQGSTNKVIRGGGWKSDETALVADFRLDWEFGGQNVGFRCARKP